MADPSLFVSSSLVGPGTSGKAGSSAGADLPALPERGSVPWLSLLVLALSLPGYAVMIRHMPRWAWHVASWGLFGIAIVAVALFALLLLAGSTFFDELEPLSRFAEAGPHGAGDDPYRGRRDASPFRPVNGPMPSSGGAAYFDAAHSGGQPVGTVARTTEPAGYRTYDGGLGL